jgi:hypothetical protein
MSEVTLDARLGRIETSPQALQHLSNTYRCVSQNLQRDGIPSDPTIAAVLTLALHEDLRGQPGRSKVHIDALQRMVELRGGITQFGSSHVLIHKICRYEFVQSLHVLNTADDVNTELILSMRFMLVHIRASTETDSPGNGSGLCWASQYLERNSSLNQVL